MAGGRKRATPGAIREASRATRSRRGGLGERTVILGFVVTGMLAERSRRRADRPCTKWNETRYLVLRKTNKWSELVCSDVSGQLAGKSPEKEAV